MKKLLYTFTILAASWAQTQAQIDFYDINTIQQIEITFVEPNWDALLDGFIAAGTDDRLIATVTVNGTQYDSVGVKYKGNSSHSPGNLKNPFNIKLDEIITNQDYQGYQSIKLSNVFKDPTFTREAYGYELARQYMPAPKANYAKVYVNGAYHGLYTNVQSANGDFLNEHFLDDTGVHFKCDGNMGTSLPVGCINGGSALEYLGTDTACYVPRYELESAYGWAQLRALTDVLKNNTTIIEQYLDVDRALWMLAFDNVLVNLDSYYGSGHNYYVYQDNNARFNTILWDCNETFGVFVNAGGGPALSVSQMQNMSSIYNQSQMNRPLMNKLWAIPKYKKAYIAHLRTILEENFSSGTYLPRIQAIQAIINADVQSDVNKFYSNADFTNNVTATASGIVGISQLMAARITYLQSDAEVVKVPPTISNVAASNNTPFIGDMVYITAGIGNATSYKLRYRNGRFDLFTEADMFDDGAHGDGAAADGVYGAQVLVPSGGLQYYIYAENANAAMFSPVRAEYEFYTLTASSTNTIAGGELVINEFMASDSATVADQDGEFNDWIELYNNTNNPISLMDIYLTDNLSNKTKWAFPDTTIAAHGYLIIWADNDTFQSGLHAYFKLSASGEQLGLYNSDGSVIDSLSFGQQTTDISYGRYVNGTGNFTVMPPTFAAENSLTVNIVHIENKFQYGRIYPNPTHYGQATLEVESATNGDAVLQVIDNLGRAIYSQNIGLMGGENKIPVECAGWAAGMYYVRLVAQNGETLVLKLEVQR